MNTENDWLDEVIRAMGGEGEFVDRERVRDLWQQFSDDFSATWLGADAVTLGNFAAWMIRTKLTETEAP